MHGIFISYRREDTAGHAGRLFDRLATRFGKDSVFMDVEGIDGGVDFVETIEGAVGRCDVLLAVIGRGWLSNENSQGKRRLDDPLDFVRVETAAALARKVRVIPVLVEGAGMPRAEELPEDLRGLTRRQAVELRDSRWEDDIHALIGVLERVPGSQTPDSGASGARKISRPLVMRWSGGVAAVVLAGAAIGYLFGPHEKNIPPAERVAPPVARTITPPPVKPSDSAPSAPVAKQEQPATRSAPDTSSGLVPATAAKKEARQPPQKPKPAPAPIQPAKRRPESPAVAITVTEPAERPAPTLAAVAPKPAPAPARKITLIALGQPTFRSFWDGENKQAYSAKVAKLYGGTLRELATTPIDLKIDQKTDEIRVLESALRNSKLLCQSTGASMVFAAMVQENYGISRIDSAFWPELRLSAIACDSGKQYDLRDILSPRWNDEFPFEKDMAETMLKFAREHRHLLQ